MADAQSPAGANAAPQTQPDDKPDKPGDKSDGEKKQRKKQEERAEEDANDARKLAKLDRDIDLARAKLHRAQMASHQAATQHEVALAKAEREHALQQQRLATFRERSVPNRIAWAQLRLTRAEDSLKETREELAQLEALYAADEFADGTKEIVLDRGRRRLERSKRDFELRREDFAILTEKTIPAETIDQELKLEQKVQALAKARREAEASELDKKIGLHGAENGVAKLEEDIQAHTEAMARRQRERTEEDEDQADAEKKDQG
ncbi:MAG: hypothetical protein IID40_09130 [Planctomycetes bacterium]|nr:hypothetical protein [Planctomycetota bacterium]